MTYDEKRAVLGEQLDNILSRLIVYSKEDNTRQINQCKIEAKRLLMEIETFISDL